MGEQQRPRGHPVSDGAAPDCMHAYLANAPSCWPLHSGHHCVLLVLLLPVFCLGKLCLALECGAAFCQSSNYLLAYKQQD